MAKTIDFKVTLTKFSKKLFPDVKFDDKGAELLSKSLNSVNDQVLTSVEKSYKAEAKVYSNTFYHCAKKAIEKIYAGSLKEPAISEALRQLALLESGCMTYGDDSGASSLLNKPQTEQETDELARFRRNQKFLSLFRSGVIKFSSTTMPSFKLDRAAGNLLGLRIHSFATMVAETAAETAKKKEELQPTDLRNLIAKYLGKDALKAANGEGSKWLLLYENGLLDFKARREIVTEWSKDSVAKEKIYSAVFLPSIKEQLKEINPNHAVDSRAPKYVGHTLMDVARHLANDASEVSERKKTIEMGKENLHEAVSLVLPEQLRQHALLKAFDDVRLYHSGILIYNRQPDEPKILKSKPKRKKTPAKPIKTRVGKGKRSAKSKRTQKKRKVSSSSYKSKKAKRQKTAVSESKPRKTGRLNFGPAIIDTLPVIFENAALTLARDSRIDICNILEDTCDALISQCVSETGTEELGLKEIKASVQQLFPGLLRDLAEAYGTNVIQDWEDHNAIVSTE